MSNTTQRGRLEARAEQLMRILSSGEKVGRDRIVAELKGVATELQALQSGTHWTQAQGDTLAKIVQRDISLSKKEMP